MNINKRRDKRTVIEALLQGNTKLLEQFKEDNLLWVTIIATQQILFGQEESPNDGFTDIKVKVHADELRSYPNMTRTEFRAFCDQWKKQGYNLFIIK